MRTNSTKYGHRMLPELVDRIMSNVLLNINIIKFLARRGTFIQSITMLQFQPTKFYKSVFVGIFFANGYKKVFFVTLF